MADKLTMKQEIFCQEWVDSLGNGTRAALKAFDIEGKELLEIDFKKLTEEQSLKIKQVESTASSMANEYLRKPDVNKRISEILNERGFNDEAVEKEHFKLLKQDTDYGVKMRAISDFYKLKGRYAPEKTDITSQGEKINAINYIIPNGNDNTPTNTETTPSISSS